jgi:putative ABC transport system permease protein
MGLITLRDLQFRRRRFAITVLGTMLVFSLALVLAGMSNGFREEARVTVASLGADAWVVPDGASGPFTSFAAQPEELTTDIEAIEGVEAAGGVAVFRADFRHEDELFPAHFIGYPTQDFGALETFEGREPRVAGEATVDEAIGFDIGQRFSVFGVELEVVGLTENHTVYTGVPNVYVELEDAQAIGFGGQPVATSFVVRGSPEGAPDGFFLQSGEEAEADLLRPTQNGNDSIDLVLLLLWAVAAMIVGAVVYLSTLERTRDFAVLKAVGASTRQLYAGLAIQAAILAIVAALLASVVAPFIGPFFPMPVVIPLSAFVSLPVLAVAVGLVASLVGLRRVATVDPAIAFGGAG